MATTGVASNWLEVEIMDHILGRSSTLLSTGAHATIYMALRTTTHSDAWLPSDTGECAGSTYARVAITNSSANWQNSTGGVKVNKTAISFTTAAGADWGTIKSWALVNTNSTVASSTAYMLFGGDLDSNQVIASGNSVSFAAGALSITAN